MGAAVVALPTATEVTRPRTVVLPDQIRVKVSRYVINLAAGNRHSISKCPIARAAFFALRRSIGPGFNVEVSCNVGDAARIDVFISDSKAARYLLPGGARFIAEFDNQLGAASFDAVAHRI